MSNENIVSQINSGNLKFMQLLIIRHMPVIHRMAIRYSGSESEIEDLEQIALIALCNAVKSYNSEKISFSAFAGMCIRRAFINEYRSAGMLKRVPAELMLPFDECDVAVGQTPETIFMEKENFRRLTETIQLELSKLEYKVLQCFLSGVSYTHIANKLGISEKSVDNALRRIRSKLKGRFFHS